MPDITPKFESTSRKVQSFLEGPILPVAAVGAGVIYFWGLIIPFLLKAANDTFHFVTVGLCLGAIFFMIGDPKMRAFLYYLYRSLIRYLTSQFIEIDPIGILKTYKERLEGKLADMDHSIAELAGQKSKVDRIIRKNKDNIEKSLSLVDQAVKTGDIRMQGVEGKQASRLSTQNERMSGDFNRISFLLEVLNKYRQLSADTIQDMGSEISTRQVDADYAKSSRNVVRSALAILKGLPEKEFYDDSLAVLERQYTDAIGEVESFLDVTKDIMSKADLQDGADAARAMDMLKTWQAKNSGVMLGAKDAGVSKADIIESAKQLTGPSVPDVLPKSAYQPVTSHPDENDYQKFFRGK